MRANARFPLAEIFFCRPGMDLAFIEPVSRFCEMIGNAKSYGLTIAIGHRTRFRFVGTFVGALGVDSEVTTSTQYVGSTQLVKPEMWLFRQPNYTR